MTCARTTAGSGLRGSCAPSQCSLSSLVPTHPRGGVDSSGLSRAPSGNTQGCQSTHLSQWESGGIEIS